jgi:hypothetical protein
VSWLTAIVGAAAIGVLGCAPDVVVTSSAAGDDSGQGGGGGDVASSGAGIDAEAFCRQLELRVNTVPACEEEVRPLFFRQCVGFMGYAQECDCPTTAEAFLTCMAEECETAPCDDLFQTFQWCIGSHPDQVETAGQCNEIEP